MKILISNDDGLMANGITALTMALAEENDVYVIAPDRERSAAGHSLTLHTPLRVEELEPKFGAKRNWVTTGTPGDCVKIGVSAILADDEKPDFILSGINHGPNLGSDILYSGTVSCALEGAMLGYPGIATSLCSTSCEPEDFVSAAQFMAKFLPKLKDIAFPEKSILNINFPALELADIAGVRITELGSKMFTNEYEKRTDPRGKVYYWLAGELIGSEALHPNSDIEAIRESMISITPVSFDLTNRSAEPMLKKTFDAKMFDGWFE